LFITYQYLQLNFINVMSIFSLQLSQCNRQADLTTNHATCSWMSISYYQTDMSEWTKGKCFLLVRVSSVVCCTSYWVIFFLNWLHIMKSKTCQKLIACQMLNFQYTKWKKGKRRMYETKRGWHVKQCREHTFMFVITWLEDEPEARILNLSQLCDHDVWNNIPDKALFSYSKFIFPGFTITVEHQLSNLLGSTFF